MRLKIGFRIGLGFGIILLAVIVNAWLTSNSLNKSREVNDKITKVYNPSLETINKLYNLVNDTRMLIKSWVHIEKKTDTPDKKRLKNIHSEEFLVIADSLNNLKEDWEPEHKEMIHTIMTTISDTLFDFHRQIMNMLNSFDSYEDFLVEATTTTMVDETGDVIIYTNKVIDMIIKLQKEQEEIVHANQEKMISTFDKFRSVIIIMMLALIIISVIIGTVTINSLVKPINGTKNILTTLSNGIIPDNEQREGRDEIGQMGKALNALVTSLKKITAFTVEIGKGNFDTEFHAQNEDDNIGQALLNMRVELKKAKEDEEKRQEENRQRTWTSQGVALFSDILRQNNQDLEKLTYEIISNMVSYTNSNQGGIFLLNDIDPKNPFLEMNACYAYDRQKFITKKIEIGEGLVGRCYQESEKIFLTDIPADYIKITSGLGDDTPKSLLLIPLAYNDNIFGIIEIASFNIYQPYEIDFIERVGESIAATISSVKSNIQTAELLERTRQQAEEMHSQEEEMRQNMEELRATQEQSTRREEELSREVELLKKRIRDLQGGA